MSCKGCEEAYGEEADRCCGFPDGKFSSSNDNCVTLNRLRTLCDDGYYQSPPGRWQWSHEQQSLFTLPFDRKFVVLGTYKARGRTECAVVIDEEKTRPLTLAEAEEAIEYWRARPTWLVRRPGGDPVWGGLLADSPPPKA